MNKQITWLLKEKYHNRATKKFERDVLRLKRGEPLDYVIGFAEFLGCKIDLSKKPFIPRPETEFWVKETIEIIKKSYSQNERSLVLGVSLYIRILDIFSGSGCIGLAILKHIKNASVDFADIDRKCLEQAKINCQINKISPARYKIIKSDVFKNIKGKYDFILANPPYIAETRKSKIQKSVLKYEPRQALFGGKDGLFYIRRFLKEAKNHLNKEGKIYMEFDFMQKKEIEKILRKFRYNNFEFKKDQYNKWRWLIAS